MNPKKRFGLFWVFCFVVNCAASPHVYSPSKAQAHFIAGNLHENEDRLDKAMKEYRKALNLDPENPVIHQRIGSLCIRKGDFEGSIRWFEKSLELDPDDVKTRLLLALIDLSLRKFDEAKKQYEIILAQNPRDLKALSS